MSVLVLSHESYSYILTGVRNAAFNHTCNEFYSWSMYRHFDNPDIAMDQESIRLVKSWLTLNESTYFERYPDEPKEYTAELFTWELTGKQTAVQLLKYLQCVDYNIEGQDEHPDVILLRQWINDLKNSIINTMPQYQAAQWCD